MSDEIDLWCWVQGDVLDSVFLVSIKHSATVSKLRDAIWARKPSFQHINSNTLKLLKFELPLETLDEDYAQSVELDVSQELTSWKRISFYWKEAPAENILSIILPRPPVTTITPSSSQNSNLSLNSPPLWLVEIHSKLWGRDDLFGQIFRTANLTKADFIELQRQLQELNSKRNSKSYVAKNVLATKSAFLRSRSKALVRTNLGNGLVPRLVFDASQPPSSDAVDDSVDDDVDVDVDDNTNDDMDHDADDDAGIVAHDTGVVAGDAMDNDPDTGASGINIDLAHLSMEAATIFPYTVQYMDLTVLELKANNLRVPQLILFRHEWGSIIDIFNERTKGMRGSAIFTGQPGIGKTCLLYSILVLCVVNAQPIVFQDMRGAVFIIDDTVHPPKDEGILNPENNDVLSLVDADGSSCQPHQYFYTNYNHRILLTSSPRKREDRKWLTQRAQDSNAVFVMEPWSRAEIVVALLFFERLDITLKRFQETSRICGNIPRRCIEWAESPVVLKKGKYSIKDAIKDADTLLEGVLNVKRCGIIHRAFQIRPSETRFWYGSLIEPVSDWALSEMIAELDRRGANGAYTFYHAIQGSPGASTLRGIMFENKLHSFLQTFQTPRTFTIQSLDDPSTTLDIEFTSETKHLTFGVMQSFSGQLASSVRSHAPCYLQLQSPVFPSFNSLLYQPDISQSSFSPLIALQVTTATMHDINIKGLEKVQKSLKPNISVLKDLQPTKARKMIILFVVPDTMGAAFLKQKIIGAVKVEHWYEKTAQYVLVLSEKEVFQVM